jgi:RNA polymerase sigma-70 factor (ECF subfamily)
VNQVHKGPTNNNGWCELLYENQAAKLILYGRALGLSHAEAEDVLQETFVALLKLAEPPERPDHYGLRSFRNRALNYRRNLWQRIRRELESHRWFERTEAETAHEAAAMRCLARLPREQREVIVLKIWHDRTFEEIGSLLAISPNTAAARYRYGIRKLRTFFEGANYESIDSLGRSVAPLDPAPPCLGT